MKLPPSEVRKRVEQGITDLGSDWKRSIYAAAFFGRDSRHLVHQGFSVEYAGDAEDPPDQRQKRPEGVQVDAQIIVRYAWLLRGDNQVADQDAALDASRTLIAAVMDISLVGLHVAFEGSAFSDLSAESRAYLLGELTFSCLYRRALE